MKESRLQRYVDFIGFNFETGGYQMSVQAEHYVAQVLEGEMDADEAVATIMSAYPLEDDPDVFETPDGCYPDSEVYVNYFGIRNQALLDEIESGIVAVRMAEILRDDQNTAFNFDRLKMIHERLFSDIYPFAGVVRTISVTRRTLFCLPQYIDRMAHDIFTKLRKDHLLRHQEHEEFINNLAYYMAEVHALHPFLDGNTRTMRIFFQQLAIAAGWDLDLASVDDGRMLEADISALEGDYQPLIGILHEAVKPLEDSPLSLNRRLRS